MYSVPVILTLLGMITMGAARIVAIKIYYQIELEESRPVTPLFVTLLYLSGQALSLVVHFVYTRLGRSSIHCCRDRGIGIGSCSCICVGKAKQTSQGYDTIDTAVRKLESDRDHDDDDDDSDNDNDNDFDNVDDNDDDIDIDIAIDDHDSKRGSELGNPTMTTTMGTKTTTTITAAKPVSSLPTTPKPIDEEEQLGLSTNEESSIASSSSHPNDGLVPIDSNNDSNINNININIVEPSAHGQRGSRTLDFGETLSMSTTMTMTATKTMLDGVCDCEGGGESDGLITTVAADSTAAAAAAASTHAPQTTKRTCDTASNIHRRPRRRGSKTGLTEESEAAAAWVHAIPWYLKPVAPGFFNLCNSALRWACLVYVAASTAEILISGLELVLSSIAARVLRKRAISRKRWTGVAIITAGVLLVGCDKLLEARRNSRNQQDRNDNDNDNTNRNTNNTDETHDFLVGNVLIFGQCVFSVLQDLSEEIFLQEADFPATLLLGMEGLFGLVFGLPIVAIWFGDELYPDASRTHARYELGLVLLVLVTGILNIRTTEVTSSMTRNVWKQFRIMLVWVLALLVYYLGGTIRTSASDSNDNDYDNDNGGDNDGDSGARFGEPWVSPDSWFVLGGFAVVLSGLSFYYSG